MASLWLWIAVGMVAYTLGALALRAQGRLPDSVKLSGPLMTIHTKRGRIFLDRLADRERFWRAWGNFGVGVALVVMVLSGIGVAFSVLAVLQQPQSATIENPQNVLVIPGVNDFLPLNAAGEIVFGLLVGLVVHEGGHGLLCRVEDIEIESMGVALLAFIPMGAFVEPDPDNQREANRGAQIRMFAAGITNNFAVTIIAILLLVGPVLGSIGAVAGAPVGDTFPGSGAEEAGLEHGDVITAVNGTTVENSSQLETAVANVESDTVQVTLKDGENRTVERRLLIFGIVEGLADSIQGRDPLTRVEAVNDTTVNTERDFARAVEDRPVVTLRTDRGNATIPIGVFVNRVDEGGALAGAGAPTDGTPVVITSIDGQRVKNDSEYSSTLDEYEAGDTASVVGYVQEQKTGNVTTYERTTYNVTVGESSLGASVQPGYSGILFDDFGVDTYPAEQFLAVLQGDAVPDDASLAGSVLSYALLLLILPFAALMDPSLNYSFAGFTPDVTSFFVVQGPLGFLGGGLFIIANLLFWTGWINFNLALFNCIPAFPLDGGHLLRVGSESIVSRLPISQGRTVVTLITVGVTLAMAGALATLVFGPLWF